MRLTIRKPDDWHVHFRDGDMLRAVAPEPARDCARALVMPNLVPPVVRAEHARAYRERIRAALHDAARRGAAPDTRFTPLMTLYLTEDTDPADVVAAAADGVVHAVKLYPAGATTNSESGVRDIARVSAVLEAMAEHAIPLCVHGEVTDPAVDIFDREARFVETVLLPLRERLPELRVTLEHVTTAEGVAAVSEAERNLAGSITPHHLVLNRNDLLVGGVRPHHYCLPILKRERHREALLVAATGADPRFFLGTDSAPHPRGAKESACGCAGVFVAGSALAWLAEVFEAAAALHALESFASLNGAHWYGLEPNDETITLERVDAPLAPESPLTVGDDVVVPFAPERTLHWRVREPGAPSR